MHYLKFLDYKWKSIDLVKEYLPVEWKNPIELELENIFTIQFGHLYYKQN